MRKNSSGIATMSIFILLAILILPAVAISLRGLREKVIRADVALVLGSKVYKDGAVSSGLAGRLDRAHFLYREGVYDRIIVSGGVGSSGFDEAAAMKSYLVARGVPPEQIVADSSGVNTRASVDFTVAYMRENGLDSVMVITQFFHIPRAMMAIKSSGIPEVGSSYARHFELMDIYSTLREVPAFFSYSLGLK